MVGEWRDCLIGEIADVIGGSTPSTRDSSNFDGEIPWLTPKDLSGLHDRYIARGERNLTQRGLTNCSAQLLPAGTVLLSSRAPIGYVAIAKNPIATNQGFRSLLLRPGFVPEFIYYWLTANVPKLERYASGSTFKELSGSALKQISILVPSEREQRAIAHILGSLDDKIDLNRRMNGTLEMTARAIFKSQFVDLDTIHAKTGDWRKGKVGDLASLSRETISPNECPDEIFDHYSIPAFDEGRLPKVEMGKKIQSNKFVVSPNAVLLSKLNPRIPRIWYVNVRKNLRSVCSTEFLVITPQHDISREFLYGLFNSRLFLEIFATLVTGTSGSHQRVKPEYLLAMDVAIPPSELIARFTKIAQPLYKQTIQNIEESYTLATLRDTLLPKLISGELRIKDAERIVGASV